MAKYLKKKSGKSFLVVLLVLLIIVGAVVWMLWDQNGVTLPDPSGTAEPSAQTATQGQTAPAEQATEDPILLTDGLELLYIGEYTGMYMEDGTNEVVSGVMMIMLENTADRDLQLARIEVVYDDFTAQFEVTNLPAGEKLVALERSRHEVPAGACQSVEAKNVVFFDAPMDPREDDLRFSGSEGLMAVENISGEDITADIYIYYKNSSKDLLYGGITYRVIVEGGVPAGETVQVFTGHYAPESSRIMAVEYGA